jgi:hypothetical protein
LPPARPVFDFSAPRSLGNLGPRDKTLEALNEKLAALAAKRDKYVADQRATAAPKRSSFDRVVEDTLKAQIKR